MLSKLLKLLFICNNLSITRSWIFNTSNFSSKFRTCCNLIISSLRIRSIVSWKDSTIFSNSLSSDNVVTSDHSDLNLSLITYSNSFRNLFSNNISDTNNGNTCQSTCFNYSVDFIFSHFIMILPTFIRSKVFISNTDTS